MDEDDVLRAKIYDQLSWLCDNHESFSNQQLEYRINGLYQLLLEINFTPTHDIFSTSFSDLKVSELKRKRNLRI